MKVGLTEAVLTYCQKQLPEASILISHADGTELLATDPSTSFLSDLVPGFLSNIEQATRLRAGEVESTIVWLPIGVVYQTKKDDVVFSILLNENANIGLVDQEVEAIYVIIKPNL